MKTWIATIKERGNGNHDVREPEGMAGQDEQRIFPLDKQRNYRNKQG